LDTLWHAVHHILESGALARVLSALPDASSRLTAQSVLGAIYDTFYHEALAALGDDRTPPLILIAHEIEGNAAISRLTVERSCNAEWFVTI
jgi:hypothetical protein